MEKSDTKSFFYGLTWQEFFCLLTDRKYDESDRRKDKDVWASPTGRTLLNVLIFFNEIHYDYFDSYGHRILIDKTKKVNQRLTGSLFLWLLFSLQKICNLTPYLCTVIQKKHMFNLLIFFSYGLQWRRNQLHRRSGNPYDGRKLKL